MNKIMQMNMKKPTKFSTLPDGTNIVEYEDGSFRDDNIASSKDGPDQYDIFKDLLSEIQKALKGASDKYYNNNIEDLKNAYRNYMTYMASETPPVDTPEWYKLAKNFERILKPIYTGDGLSREDLVSADKISDDIRSFIDDMYSDVDLDIEETDVDNDGDVDKVEIKEKGDDEEACPQCGGKVVNGTCSKCHLNVPLSKKFTELLFKPKRGADGFFGW